MLAVVAGLLVLRDSLSLVYQERIDFHLFSLALNIYVGPRLLKVNKAFEKLS